MQAQPVQAIQNSNSGMIKPIEAVPQNKLNAVDAKAIASPTPVISGAPTQTQQTDTVELSNKKDKKFDKTMLFAFCIGILIAGISMLGGKKTPKA